MEFTTNHKVNKYIINIMLEQAFAQALTDENYEYAEEILLALPPDAHIALDERRDICFGIRMWLNHDRDMYIRCQQRGLAQLSLYVLEQFQHGECTDLIKCFGQVYELGNDAVKQKTTTIVMGIIRSRFASHKFDMRTIAMLMNCAKITNYGRLFDDFPSKYRTELENKLNSTAAL